MVMTLTRDSLTLAAILENRAQPLSNAGREAVLGLSQAFKEHESRSIQSLIQDLTKQENASKQSYASAFEQDSVPASRLDPTKKSQGKGPQGGFSLS